MTTHTPTAEELQAWTNQTRDFLAETGKKRLPKEMREDLLAQGAKWCSTCQNVLAVTEFGRRAASHDGLQFKCKPCMNGYNAEYIEANRERWNEYQRTRYATNETHRLRIQLDDGYRRAVEAGVQADWVTGKELLSFWDKRGIDPLVCYLTGAALTPQTRSINHATPISRGGPHQLSNLIPVSLEASRTKGSRTVAEFWAALSEKEQE